MLLQSGHSALAANKSTSMDLPMTWTPMAWRLARRGTSRENRSECLTKNCKASFDLILGPSATSVASLYSEHVAQVPGEGVDSPPPGGARQGHLVEEHVGWKMWLWPSLENAICHLQSLKVHWKGLLSICHLVSLWQASSYWFHVILEVQTKTLRKCLAADMNENVKTSQMSND